MRNLEDMMQYYKPDARVLETAMEDDGEEKMTGKDKERILALTLEKTGLSQKSDDEGRREPANHEPMGERIHSGGRSRRWKPALLAACIAIFAMAGIGYATGGLDNTFKAWFSPSSEEQLKALEQAGTVIEQEVEDNGTILRIREAIGDESTVNVLFDLIAPEGTVLDAENYTFYQPMVRIKTKSHHGAGYSFEEFKQNDRLPNVYSAILSLSSDAKLDGANISLDLNDLCVYKNEDEQKAAARGTSINDADYIDDCYRVVVPGQWKIDFTLNYKDTSVKVYPNKIAEKQGTTAVVEELRVSPISLSVELKTRGIKELIQYVIDESSRSNWFRGTAEDVRVVMKDGSVLESSSTGSSGDGRKMLITWQYEKMIDVKEIDSITFCGVELWKNQ